MNFQSCAKGLTALAITAMLGISAVKPTSAATAYTVTDLGSLGGAYSVATGITPNNHIVGYVVKNGSTTAFSWDGQSYTDFGTIDGNPTSFGLSMNNSGNVVGYCGSYAFVTNGTQMSELDNLGGSTAAAYGTDSNGDIVGFSATSKGAFHAFEMLNGGSIQDIGTLGGAFSLATSISDTGFVTGYSSTAAGPQHAFLFKHGHTMRDLGTLGTFSIGQSVDNNGDVVGWSTLSDNYTHHAFYVAHGGSIVDLGALPSTYGPSFSVAYGINNKHQIVGTSGGHGIIWNGTVLKDINAALAPGTAWTILQASGINDNGSIAATGRVGGTVHALLLSPYTVSATVNKK